MWKKWVVLLALFAGALVLASFHGGRISYMLLYLVPALALSSLLYVCWVMLRFKFYQRVNDKTVVKGEPADYYLTLRNEEKCFYSGIEVKFFQDYSEVSGVEQPCVFSLAGGEKRELTTRLCCNYRGEYAVGVECFYISDYLGLFHVGYRVPEPLKVTVLPRITAWQFEREILEEPEGRLQGQASRTGEPDFSVRAYEAGDSLRRIHWKATARRGELMSRETAEVLRQGLLLFLDLRPRGEGVEELRFEDEMIEQAVAMVYACRGRGIPVTVLCEVEQRQSCPVFLDSQWQEFYRACGKLPFLAATPVQELFTVPEVKTSRYAVVLTGIADGALCESMRGSLAGMKSSVILVTGETCSGRAVFEEAGIGFYEVRLR